MVLGKAIRKVEIANGAGELRLFGYSAFGTILAIDARGWAVGCLKALCAASSSPEPHVLFGRNGRSEKEPVGSS
jgi:hypothetical protein